MGLGCQSLKQSLSVFVCIVGFLVSRFVYFLVPRDFIVTNHKAEKEKNVIGLQFRMVCLCHTRNIRGSVSNFIGLVLVMLFNLFLFTNG